MIRESSPRHADRIEVSATTPPSRGWWLSACVILALSMAPALGQEEPLAVADLGLASGFQDNWGNQYRRGRSIVADDFDGDGRLDYFIGNPGDESFVFRNLGPGPDGVVRFAPDQILLWGDLAFEASGADYDNDGDLDLFVGCGGLDGACLDFLFRNDSTPGWIRFTEVSGEAGIRGPAEGGIPIAHSSGGGTWGDYDRDGDTDLFVSLRSFRSGGRFLPGILWRNNGHGTFKDATAQSRLFRQTRDLDPQQLVSFELYQNSSWIDVDNDGDLDLFLNNSMGPNMLWRNLLAERGAAIFIDGTKEFSLPGEDLRFPYFSFANAVADFNNDGWQDLMLFAIGGELPVSPYGSGNGLFLNRQGRGFFNAASAAAVNVGSGRDEVAMGCQVADLNADGIPDLAIGAGDPMAGQRNRLLLSTTIDAVGIPHFEDASALIDFPAEHGIDPTLPPYPEAPPYPYRGHGIAAGDADGDGHLELGIVNGGPANRPAIVREPNRLFRFSGTGLGRTFRVRLRGNGTSDGRDAIGARAYVELAAPGGTRRVFQTVLGGSGFSAQNERTLTFGLGSETAVSRLAILWPSGCLQVQDPPPAGRSPLELKQGRCWTCAGAVGPVDRWLDPEGSGCTPPPPCRIEGTLTDASGPVPWTRVVESYGDPPADVDGRSGPDGTFSLEHPYEPSLCSVQVFEPFGYLPVANPVRVAEDISGTEVLELLLSRAPEALWPRGAGYWLHEAKAIASDRVHAHEDEAEMAAWREAIRDRYPALAGFESVDALSRTLGGSAPRQVGERLHRHLATALLNLASGRLSSYTVLTTGERVGDLVEEAYRWLADSGTDPTAAARVAAKLEALNEGKMFR